MKVPWLPKNGIQLIAEDIIAGYESKLGCVVRPPIPVEDIIERYFDLKIGFVDFEKNYGMQGVLGATYVKKGLICANTHLLSDCNEGRLVFTFAHEVGHWVLHRKYINDDGGPRADRTAILCRKKDAKKPIEWQADYFAACMLLPEKWVRSAFEKSVGSQPIKFYNEKSVIDSSIYIEPCVSNWPFIAQAVQNAGGFLNVSKQALIIRLQELGLIINETTAKVGWGSRQYAT